MLICEGWLPHDGLRCTVPAWVVRAGRSSVALVPPSTMTGRSRLALATIEASLDSSFILWIGGCAKRVGGAPAHREVEVRVVARVDPFDLQAVAGRQVDRLITPDVPGFDRGLRRFVEHFDPRVCPMKCVWSG